MVKVVSLVVEFVRVGGWGAGGSVHVICVCRGGGGGDVFQRVYWLGVGWGYLFSFLHRLYRVCVCVCVCVWFILHS